MTTRKVTTIEENVPEGESVTLVESDDLDEQLEEASIDALDGLISEFAGGSDHVVNVYRQGDGKNISFLFRTNPGEMTGGEIMEKCRDKFGTGDYRVHVRQGRRLVANRPFSVERELEPEVPENNGQLGVAEILTIMQANNDRTMQMFSETMRAMGEALGNRNQQQIDPVAMQSTIMQSVAALKQMTEKPDNSRDAVEMLVEGLKIAQQFNPKDGETNTSDILVKALETFGKPLVEAGQHAQTQPGNGRPMIPADPQAAADAQREREMGMRQMMIKQQLGFLVTQAANGKNSELYAELLLDQLGVEIVLDFVGKPDAMDQLIAIDPRVAQFRPWFEGLRANILELTAAAPQNDSEGLFQGAPEFGQPGSVIIPGVDQSAIPDAADAGNVTGDPAGSGGDTDNA